MILIINAVKAKSTLTAKYTAWEDYRDYIRTSGVLRTIVTQMPPTSATASTHIRIGDAV